jgi:hypothetical protein
MRAARGITLPTGLRAADIIESFRADLRALGIEPFQIPDDLLQRGPDVRWPLKRVER